MNLDIAKIFDRITRETGTEVKEIEQNREGKGIPFIVIDEGRKVIQAADVVAAFEKTQPAPYRRKGIYQASNVDSLLRWMEVEAGKDSPVFGVGVEKLNGEWRAPRLSLIGIGNYSAADKAAWHDFAVRYDFPVSLEWTIWAAGHSEEGKPNYIAQADFAEFIEARIHDLSSPKSGDKASEAVTRFLEASGKKDAATPAQMFRISRDLKIMSNEKIEVKMDLQSGEAKMQYSQEHQGAGGHPVKLPSLFYIRIPVFFGQKPVLIGVKLRYRAGGGSVAWAYSLFAPDMVVHDEFMAACEAVTHEQRTLYLGAPDNFASK